MATTCSDVKYWNNDAVMILLNCNTYSKKQT